MTSTGAHQSDLRRRFPSFVDRRRKFSDSILRASGVAFSGILFLHDNFFCAPDSPSRSSGQQFIRMFWILFLLGFFTCVLRRARLLLLSSICPSLFLRLFDLVVLASIIVVSSNFARGIPISPELCDVGHFIVGHLHSIHVSH